MSSILSRDEKSDVRSRTLDICLKAAKQAGAIDTRRVAFGILKAVSHKTSPPGAIAKLQHWQPGLFRSTQHLTPPTPPPIKLPEGFRPSAEGAKRTADEARAAIESSARKYGTEFNGTPRDMR